MAFKEEGTIDHCFLHGLVMLEFSCLKGSIIFQYYDTHHAPISLLHLILCVKLPLTKEIILQTVSGMQMFVNQIRLRIKYVVPVDCQPGSEISADPFPTPTRVST